MRILGLLAVGFLIAPACMGKIDGSVGSTPSGSVGSTPSGSGESAPVGPGPKPGAPGLTPLGPSAKCDGPATASRQRLWRLDDGQYGKTVAAALKSRSSLTNDDLLAPSGFKTPLGIVGGNDAKFTTRATDRHVQPLDAEDLSMASYDVAERLLADPAIMACVNGAGPLRGCLEVPLLQKAEILFRRPVVAADVAHYLAGAEAVAATPGGRREGARAALQGLLLSPRFVFRTELGVEQGGRLRLDAYEVADALSYSLTDGPPDQALWADAKSGATLQPEVIKGHVTRLLAGAEKKGPVRKFVRELFGFDNVLLVSKPEKFHNPDLLLREIELFTENVLRKNAHKDFFKELLTSRNGQVSPATAPSYNTVLTGTGSVPQPFTFTGERQGLFGHPAWLAGHSTPDPAEPQTVVIRGRMVYERFLCGAVPAAPVGVILAVPKDAKQTVRERLALHKKDQSCAACHRLMDGIGLGFEGFDDYGRMRDTEAGRPVVRSGELVGSEDQDGPYEGLQGLTTKLLASQTVGNCLAAGAFEFFMGRPPTDGDMCTVQDARSKYEAAGGDLAAMAQSFFVSDGFLYRNR
jgi:hypothetical protein